MASLAVAGGPATSPSPSIPWTPPSTRRESPPQTATIDIPPELFARRNALTLADVVDITLRSSTVTRIAWANARAAAENYSSAKSAWAPELSADVNWTRLKTAGTQGRTAVSQTLYGPSASITWLLFDFGGRSGTIAAAQQGLVAANWTHNAAIQDAVLEVGRAYYSYVATRALLVAQRSNLHDAETNLAAAEDRRRVGVATIADVLQARTALGQARLSLQQTVGDLAATRGALAVAAGLPATVEFDVDSLAAETPIGQLQADIDTLIAIARKSRPDLAAAEAMWAQARAQANATRARRLPSLSATGNVGRTYLSNDTSNPRDTYTFQLGISIPLFNGFGWEHDVSAAKARAEAEALRAQQIGQEAVLQVFTDYYALRTATQRVHTAEALLASANESSEAALGRYRAGVGSLLELLTAESALAQARALRVDARLTWHISLLQLAHDAGVLDTNGSVALPVARDSTSTAGSAP